MLLKLIPSLKNNGFIKGINRFLYSPYYIVLIGLLTLLSCIFGIEMWVYYLYVLCGGLLPTLICEDYLPVLAPLSMAYSSVSLKSNFALEGHSLFGGSNKIHLYILLSLIILVVGSRFIFDLIKEKERRNSLPTLFFGLIILGIAYICGGFLSETFSVKSMIFGLVEFLSIAGCYFLLYYMIDFKKLKKDYFFYIMLVYGFVLSGEVIYSLISRPDLGAVTGWGIRNNIATQIAICMSAPIYFSIKKKHAWLYILIAFAFILTSSATNSRGGAFSCYLVLFIGTSVYFVKADKKKKIIGTILLSLFALTIAGFFIAFPQKFFTLFGRIVWHNIEESSLFQSRLPIWQDGFSDFLSNPMFGKGWYDCAAERNANFTYNFIPSRYHNTGIQLIASTGLFGLIAYIYHRYQTIRLVFKKPSIEKAFVFLSIVALLFASLVDCHFFNLGPGLNYAIALLFIDLLHKQDNAINNL